MIKSSEDGMEALYTSIFSGGSKWRTTHQGARTVDNSQSLFLKE